MTFALFEDMITELFDLILQDRLTLRLSCLNRIGWFEKNLVIVTLRIKIVKVRSNIEISFLWHDFLLELQDDLYVFLLR